MANINNINELATTTSDIKYRRNEFWKNLRKFLINCKCSTNDKLRHNLLREIGVNLGTTNSTTNSKLFNYNNDVNINDDIPTQENAFKNNQCQYIYKNLEKTGKYECLFDDDIYGDILWPTQQLEKSINIINNTGNNCMNNSSINNFEENYINIQPIIDDLIKTQLNTINNDIINFQIELNQRLNLYIRKNIYKFVSFADIYDYLFYSNDGVLRQQYFKNGLNIDYKDYTDIIPYLLNIKSRLDHIKLLLYLKPNGSYHLTWILLAFELSDHEYRLNLPPKLKIDSEFQRQCFIEAVLQLARRKSLSIIESEKKERKNNLNENSSPSSSAAASASTNGFYSVPLNK